MSWVKVCRLVQKYGAPFVVNAVKAALAGSAADKDREIQRLRDFWVFVERNARMPDGKCWYCGHANEWPYHRQVDAHVPGSGCLFERYPRD